MPIHNPRLELGKTCSILEVQLPEEGLSELQAWCFNTLVFENVAIFESYEPDTGVYRLVLPTGWETMLFPYNGKLADIYATIAREFGQYQIVESI